MDNSTNAEGEDTMTLEMIGAIAAGFCVVLVTTFSFLGKMINKQVTRSFEYSVNGDRENDPGLRTSLKELRLDVKTIDKKVSNIALDYAVLKSREQLCDERHEAIAKILARLEK